jgi:uncharacterized RDD family membrane protein YckC
MEVWIGRLGERHGPYPEEQVRQWLRSGEVSRDDLGWYDGLADWQPLSVLFADVVGAAPPPFSAAAPAYYAQAPAIVTYAGFWKRVAAYIVDALVLYIPNLLIQKMMGGDAAEAAMKQAELTSAGDFQSMLMAMNHYYASMGPAFLVITLITWLYFAIMESSRMQATFGKLALGIRVTDLQGNRISFPRALGRYAAKILSSLILLIGFIMVGFTQRKQGLHDLIVNTLVVNGRVGEVANTQAPASRDNTGSFSA